MKMTTKTIAKLHNLQMMVKTPYIITHEQYDREFRGGDVPGWGTLKAHGMLREFYREVRIPEGEVFTTTPEWQKVTVYYILEV